MGTAAPALVPERSGGRSAETSPGRVCVVLVGPPGAGKSTIGRKLARELGTDLVDTDAVIEAETGRTIPDIFSNDGEPAFRRIEEDVVRRSVAAEGGIISLGGGAILSDATRELLRERTVVYLEISVAEGLRRTGAATHRPLLAGADPGTKYRELMRTRRPLYREVASVRVRTDGRSPGRVVRNILTRLGLEPLEPNLIAAQEDSFEDTGSVRRPRRRRRGGRTGVANRTAPAANSATQGEPASAAGDSNTADPDSTAAQAKPRKSRRSRRGGRRRSKSAAIATVTTSDSPTSDVGTEPGQPTSEQAGTARSGQHVTHDRAGSGQSRSGATRSGSEAAQSRSGSGQDSGPSDDTGPEGTPTRSRSSRRRRRGGSRRADSSVAATEKPGEAASTTTDRPVGSQRPSSDSPDVPDRARDKTTTSARQRSGRDSAPVPNGAGDENTTGAVQRNSRSRRPRAARRPAGPPASSPDSDTSGNDVAAINRSAQLPTDTAAAQRDSTGPTRSGRPRRRARRAGAIRAQQESEQSA